MTLRQITALTWAVACLSIGGISIAAQTLDFMAGEAAIGPIVRGAPYSADGVTTLMQTLGDGTRIERRVSAKFYRDSAGRTRREQTIVGLAALNPAGESHAVVTIVDPTTGVSYVLDPRTRVARRTPIDKRALAGSPPPPPPPPPAPAAGVDNAGAPPPAPARPDYESLGTRQIEGIAAVGWRSTTRIAAGQIGNDRSIEMTHERWESPELKLLMLSRHHDPRTGDVEFRLLAISRAEPPQDLFKVPTDYRTLDGPPPPPPAPPQRPR